MEKRKKVQDGTQRGEYSFKIEYRKEKKRFVKENIETKRNVFQMKHEKVETVL